MKFSIKKTFITALLLSVALISVVYMSCKQDKCSSVICAYGGVCKLGVCDCPAGYEGAHCDTLSQTKFKGNWEVHEQGSVTTASQYEISINADTPATKVTITNFFNYFSTPITAYISHDSITIPNQELQGKVIVGAGYIYSDKASGQYGSITLSYEVVDTATELRDDFGFYPADQSAPSAWIKTGP